MPREKLSLRAEYRARTIFVIANTLFLLTATAFIVLPIFKVISDSLDENAAVYVFRLLPRDFTLHAYKLILSERSLYRPFMISIFVSVVGTGISLTITSLLAYGLLHREMPGRTIVVYLILITMVFRAGLIPLYMVVKQLGILNTLWPIILVQSVNTFYFILMMNFFRSIPKDYAEAAEVEGAAQLQIFTRIILPLSKAGLAAVGLFYVVFYWNDFFSYIIYINDTDLYNFQVLLRNMVLESDVSGMGSLDSARVAPVSLKNAVIIVAIVPVGLLYPFLQKHFVKGVNLGGVKG
jgi:putative aldouronate transport system permease protein